MKQNNYYTPGYLVATRVSTLSDILAKKQLEYVSGHPLDQDSIYDQTKTLTRVLNCLSGSMEKGGRLQIDGFIKSVRSAVTSPEHTVLYDPKYEKLFKLSLDVGMLQLKPKQNYNYNPRSYQPVYEFNPQYTNYISRLFVTFDVIQNLVKHAPIEELYYDVILRDTALSDMTGDTGLFHVDIMYRIGGVAYFVLILQKPNILNKGEQFERKVLVPVDRLKSNVSIAIHPKFDYSEFYDIMQRNKLPSSKMPRIAHFGRLSAIIPNKKN